MQKHTKHSKISKPSTGLYAINEFTILGTPCGVIEKLVKNLKTELGEDLTVGYMDADHKAPEKEELPGLYSQYTDKINYHAFAHAGHLSDQQYQSFFQSTNVLFVNGNHFDGDQQLAVIDPKKYDSLKKRQKRLNNVKAFILKDVDDLPDFIYELVPGANEIPLLTVDDITGIADLVRQNLKIAKVKALILAGGKSQRMGQDKTQITYHGKPQVEYLYDLLTEAGLEAYISHRHDQDTPVGKPGIADSFMNLGPFGGILSALQDDPDAAWLTVAVDMPFISGESIGHILRHRDKNKHVTSYLNPENELPEPLFSIWEPASYPHLLGMLSRGISCPRKAIIKSTSKNLLHPDDVKVIRNINTPEDLKEAKELLGMKA